MKYVLSATLILIALTTYSYSEENSYSEEMKCVRWSWTGDVYDRKVVCLEWKKETKK